jgi:hypothetical protein
VTATDPITNKLTTADPATTDPTTIDPTTTDPTTTDRTSTDPTTADPTTIDPRHVTSSHVASSSSLFLSPTSHTLVTWPRHTSLRLASSLQLTQSP